MLAHTHAAPSAQRGPSKQRVVTCALEGEIGEKELVELGDQLFRYASQGAFGVVLDLSEVTHFDYRGVKPLLARAELFRKAGGDIKLCGLSPYLLAIFRSTGVHDRFDYFGSAAEAREVFELVLRIRE